MRSEIGRGESSLHTALKDWYAQPGDRVEALVDGYRVDLVRGELLVEIQTRNFSALRAKLHDLLPRHPLRLVHPLPVERWVVRLAGPEGAELSRRRSPRRGRTELLFFELTRLASHVRHPNFSLEILFTKEEELRIWRANGSWRKRGWSTHDRRLLAVQERRIFASAEDYRALLPAGLPERFTSRDLAAGLEAPRNLAQKMAYCLERMGVLEREGRGRAGYVYREV